jgi:hypothetical protein
VSSANAKLVEPTHDLASGMIPIFATLLAMVIMGPSRPRSDRYLFFPFNYLQQLSTWNVLTGLKRVELLIPRYLPNLPWREVDAQRREGVGRALSEA